MALRGGMSVLGVLISGFSVGMFRAARLGVDPFQSLMSGLEAVIPIRFGTLYLLVNAVMLVLSLALDRRKTGLATLINLTLLGYVAEWAQGLVSALTGPLGLFGRAVLLLLAIVIMCFGSAMYFNADLGVSTYDALSLVASERQSKVPFQWCRIVSDLICVTSAALLLRLAGRTWGELTAAIGPATLITALFMGPLIAWFSRRLPDPAGRYQR